MQERLARMYETHVELFYANGRVGPPSEELEEWYENVQRRVDTDLISMYHRIATENNMMDVINEVASFVMKLYDEVQTLTDCVDVRTACGGRLVVRKKSLTVMRNVLNTLHSRLNALSDCMVRNYGLRPLRLPSKDWIVVFDE